MDNVIDLHPGRRTGIYNNNIIRLLERFGVQLDSRDVDFITIIKHLKDFVTLGEDYVLEGIRISKHGLSANGLQQFLRFLLFIAPLDKVHAALCASGHSHLFMYLIVFRKVICTDDVIVLHRRDAPQSRYAHSRYKFVKSLVDNNCFESNTLERITQMDKNLSVKLNQILGDPDKEFYEKQRVLEEKVAVRLNLVQLYGSSDSDTRKRLLTELNQTQTFGLDRTTVELTFHSKMAVTAAKQRDVQLAEAHIQQTLALCHECNPCFATVMALNDVMYTFQELYYQSRNRSPHLFTSSTDHSVLAYHIICCSDEDVSNQWKRLVLLFKAMFYLNISHEFQVGPIEEVSDVNMKMAEVMVGEVGAVSDGIETRRQMVLELCKSRILERSDKHLARANMERVTNLVEDGCVRDIEKINIRNYTERLNTD